MQIGHYQLDSELGAGGICIGDIVPMNRLSVSCMTLINTFIEAKS